MKRFLFLLLCFFFLTGGTIDTFEGHSVTDSSTIEGTSDCDTIEGQTITSGYTCDGTPDWTSGILESFERGDTTFCTDDWSISDDSSAIDAKDATQAKHLSNSCLIKHDNDLGDDDYVRVTLDASVESPNAAYFGGWYYFGDIPQNAEWGLLVDIHEAGTDNRVVSVCADDDADVQKLCLDLSTVNCDSDYFDISAAAATPAWYYISLEVKVNDTCKMRVYNTSGTQINCTGGNCADQELSFSSNDNDIDYINFTARSSSATLVNAYIDSWQYSSSGWLAP